MIKHSEVDDDPILISQVYIRLQDTITESGFEKRWLARGSFQREVQAVLFLGRLDPLK